ncbi:hypothetical protein MATL_G00202620 [Megalops atlanticus]|uniref:DNA (cytosine-5)-methyltransferase N-terminal domain-containing protein n=1 Tax=Megalops atlanticus TaxID=7932 RepID=A0A9D3PIB9_MEGAT|nr:hypothetical protein MATL_G00202620 [Megalops atlanticus]
MPSNAAATTTTFKTSDFEYDAAANKMSEDRLDQDSFKEEKLANSIPTRKVGRPGRKRKQLPDYQGHYGVDAISRMLRMSQVASCEATKESVVGSKGHAGPDGQSSDQVHNGELDAHGGGAAAASSKQDRSIPENGVPREPVCRAEDSEKDGEPVPPTPRKKRGRRKLEHPEKHVEEKEESSSESVRTEGERARLRGGLGWEISLRQRPMQRITFQAGDPYYISKRKRDEWLAKWKMEVSTWLNTVLQREAGQGYQVKQ